MDRLQVDFVYNHNSSQLLLQDGAKFIRMTFMTDTWAERSSFNNGHVINNFITHIVDLTGFLKARRDKNQQWAVIRLQSWAANSQGRWFVAQDVEGWSLIKIWFCLMWTWARHSKSMSPEKFHTQKSQFPSRDCSMLFQGDASPEALEMEI